jgi:hypothetical protein
VVTKSRQWGASLWSGASVLALATLGRAEWSARPLGCDSPCRDMKGRTEEQLHLQGSQSLPRENKHSLSKGVGALQDPASHLQLGMQTRALKEPSVPKSKQASRGPLELASHIWLAARFCVPRKTTHSVCVCVCEI